MSDQGEPSEQPKTLEERRRELVDREGFWAGEWLLIRTDFRDFMHLFAVLVPIVLGLVFLSPYFPSEDAFKEAVIRSIHGDGGKVLAVFFALVLGKALQKFRDKHQKVYGAVELLFGAIILWRLMDHPAAESEWLFKVGTALYLVARGWVNYSDGRTKIPQPDWEGRVGRRLWALMRRAWAYMNDDDGTGRYQS